MTNSQLRGSTLVAVGVIVIGGGMVLGGYNQLQLAQAWAEQKDSEYFAAVTGSAPLDSAPEEISRYYNDRCGGPYRTNPYAGGDRRILTGVGVALIGGAVASSGTR